MRARSGTHLGSSRRPGSRTSTCSRTRPGPERSLQRPTTCRPRSRRSEARASAPSRARRRSHTGVASSVGTTSFWSTVRVAGTETTIRPGSSTPRSVSSCGSGAARSPRKGSSLPDDCLFCRLVREGDHVRKADGFVAVEDINPRAETHLLVIPEHHVPSFREIGEFPPDEAARMLAFVADTAREVGLEDYRVMVNVGEGAGQTIFHLHWHILGGRLRGMAG